MLVNQVREAGEITFQRRCGFRFIDPVSGGQLLNIGFNGSYLELVTGTAVGYYYIL